MGLDIRGLVEQMNREGAFNNIMNNPLAQFGRRRRRYLGATILPEVTKTANMYSEQGISFRTIIANDGTAYSPAQLKKGAISGSMDVKLGFSDIASNIEAAEYDALMQLLSKFTGSGMSMEAFAQVSDWATTTLLLPLLENNERQRWEAIDNASVIRRGDNEYTETVSYSNPTGHRIDTADDWTDDTYDPYDDIMGIVDLAASKGQTINRIITSRHVLRKLSGNAIMRERVGRWSLASGVVQGVPGRASLTAINGALSDEGLPSIELYDLQYRTQDPANLSVRFKPLTKFTMLAATGRDVELDLADDERIPLPDTLGYFAIGLPAGSSEPGRTTYITTKPNKPPRIEGESWQAGLPVIAEPEAIFVLDTDHDDDGD